jgi:pimeloyl-ACP methyl ester carboxylesterase
MSDILLVHGAWHGPWCWDDFVRHLTERKHQVRTVRFRGHDTPGRIWYRVRHYVDDVRDAVSEFADPPVLIGHSLGGQRVGFGGESCRSVVSPPAEKL